MISILVVAKLKGAKVPVKGSSKGMASTNRKLPADLDDKLRNEVEEIAVKAFKALGTSGNSRIDFLIDSKSNKVYINEMFVPDGKVVPKKIEYTMMEK